MAHKKNKTEILDKIITKSGLSQEFDWGYWDCDDYDYDYHDGYCDCYMCMPVDYEYLPEETVNYVGKRGLRYYYVTYTIGRMIDMNSIYSTQELRQKKIDYLLGIGQISTKLTLADFWNIRK